jgi:hypothetical protein
MTKPIAINIGGPPSGDPKQPMPASGLDDAEVRTMARRCARDDTVPPAEFLAKLDARQARIFKDACPKNHGKKARGGA